MKAGQIRRSGGFSDLQKRQDFEGRAPRLYETGGSSSTFGAPTITPVKTIAANSASKLNKSRGTSGLVSYLSKSTCMTA